MNKLAWGVLKRTGGSDNAKNVHDLIILSEPEVFFGRTSNIGSNFSHTKQDVIPVQYASGTHFSIAYSEKACLDSDAEIEYILTDLSRNGTFVNNYIIGTKKTKSLQQGDVISLQFKGESKVEYTFSIVYKEDELNRNRQVTSASASSQDSNKNKNNNRYHDSGMPSLSPDASAASAASVLLMSQIAQYEKKQQELIVNAADLTSQIAVMEVELIKSKQTHSDTVNVMTTDFTHQLQEKERIIDDYKVRLLEAESMHR
jgi:hypothetical protein